MVSCERRRSLSFAWLAALLLACVSFVSAPTPAHAEGKVAVIDLRRAVADTEDGLRVQAKLQQLFDNRQSEYEAKEKTYAEAKAEFEQLSKSGKADDNDLRKKYAALEKLAFELQNAQVSYRREMQRQENELMYPIIKQMLGLVRRLASQSGYDMVLNKDAVPYFRSDLDITDRIIQMYNAAQATPEPGKAPANAPPAASKPAKAPAQKPAPSKK